jgi:hypothetical protein
MAWWDSLVHRITGRGPGLGSVHADPSGWTASESDARSVTWHDDAGNALTLHVVDETELPRPLDDAAVQAYFRRLAESVTGGLVEARIFEWTHGPAVQGIYKKRSGPTSFAFAGFLCMPMPLASLMFAMAARERGITGLREAIVTAQLLERGVLSPDSFSRTWAQDPYDPGYRALERVPPSVLRCGSDAEEHDGVVADHPLSRMRRTFRELRASVAVDAAAFGVARARAARGGATPGSRS